MSKGEFILLKNIPKEKKSKFPRVPKGVQNDTVYKIKSVITNNQGNEPREMQDGGNQKVNSSGIIKGMSMINNRVSAGRLEDNDIEKLIDALNDSREEVQRLAFEVLYDYAIKQGEP